MKSTVAALAGLLLIAAPAGAAAQTAPAQSEAAANPDDTGEILVVGMGDKGYRISADQLRDAARAWRDHRPSFAPQATLSWKVIPRDGASLDGLALILSERDGEEIELPVGADNRVILPMERLLQGRWQLSANRQRAAINLRPEVRSPGTSDRERRFGDMRVQCRVFWAFANNEAGFLTRVGGGIIGICSSSRVGLYSRPDISFTTARIMPGALPVETRSDGKSVRWPLHDRSISNEARMVLE